MTNFMKKVTLYFKLVTFSAFLLMAVIFCPPMPARHADADADADADAQNSPGAAALSVCTSPRPVCLLTHHFWAKPKNIFWDKKSWVSLTSHLAILTGKKINKELFKGTVRCRYYDSVYLKIPSLWKNILSFCTILNFLQR